MKATTDSTWEKSLVWLHFSRSSRAQQRAIFYLEKMAFRLISIHQLVVQSTQNKNFKSRKNSKEQLSVQN